MSDFGFMRCAVVSLSGKLLDCEGNAQKIIDEIEKADKEGCAVLSFQMLALTGVTCGDMFCHEAFLYKAEQQVVHIARATSGTNVCVMLGFPLKTNRALHNAIAIIQNGTITAIKMLPYDKKPFTAASPLCDEVRLADCNQSIPVVQNTLNCCLGERQFTVAVAGMTEPDNWPCADVIVAAGAVPCYAGYNFSETIQAFSKMSGSIVLFSNAGAMESTGERVYGGECCICEAGRLLAESDFLSGETVNPDKTPVCIADCDIQLTKNTCSSICPHGEPVRLRQYEGKKLLRPLEKFPYMPSFLQDSKTMPAAAETFFMQVLDYSAYALMRRLSSIGTDRVVLGISGGIDSTFALLVCVRCFVLQRKSIEGITAITMPCFGTTKRTKNNALQLAVSLGIRAETIDISKTVLSHFKDIGQDPQAHTVTFENAQARERTQVLMDKANQLGAIVVSASDLSEIALGWSTFAGDHISMFNTAASLPKTLLKKALHFFADKPHLFSAVNPKVFSKTMHSILETPISPELLPAQIDGTISQKTESIIGAYELHDFFTYHFVHNHFSKDKILFLAETAFADSYSSNEIKRCMDIFFKRFFANQFKRSCSPEGPAVLPTCLTGKSGWSTAADIPKSDFFNSL